MLAPDGWLITNTTTFVNIPNYPDKEAIMAEIEKLPRHITLDADQIAKDLGSARSANMVVLGAASPFLDIEFRHLEAAIHQLFDRKGEKVVNLNLEALKAGREISHMKAQA